MSKKSKRDYTYVFLVTSTALVIFSLIYLVLPRFLKSSYDVAVLREVVTDVKNAVAEIPPPKPEVVHMKTPEPLKALYMSSCAAGTPSFRERLGKLIDETELNAIMIDIKDYTGALSYVPTNPALTEYVSDRCRAKDMKEYIKSLHEKDIYVIGRITVFQDPLYTKLHPDTAVRTASTNAIWKDRKGISYIDPSSKAAWDHVIAIAKDAYEIGFDEINYDYIRFPSDGNMKDIAFLWSQNTPKADALEEFFKYLHQEMEKADIVTSADLFGMTTTSYDDMNIGQVLERALPYFDYVAPMVYPSHYPPTFNGWKNPNAHPYDLVKFVMGRGVERAEADTTRVQTLDGEPVASTSPQLYTKDVHNKLKLRTWIQDFDLGQPDYGPEEVRAQIQATYDAGLTSWMLWDASNRYTADALLPQ
jgi:hypothetical protein